MAKRIRGILSILLVLCVFASAMPLQALAAEAEADTQTTTTTEGGLTTETTTTTTTTTDEEGNVTVVVTIEKTTEGTDENGATVEGSEIYTQESTTSADGTSTASQWEEEGSEKLEWDEEIPETQTGMPEVEVELKPGETATETVTDSTTVIEGDVPEGENDEEYDYTETTTTIDRTVEATVSTPVIQEKYSESELNSISNESYEGKDDIASSGLKYSDGTYWDYHASAAAQTPQPDAPGYDYQYTGMVDVATDPYRVDLVTVTYKKDPVTGEPMVDEDGNYIIESLRSINPASGKETSNKDGYPTQVKMFVLTQYTEEGEVESRHFAYCIDADTPTSGGSWYTVSNLEDSGYFPDEESEDHLRAIVMNGYWGTEEGIGSVKQIKDTMLKDFDEDDTITVTDKNGNECTYNVMDIINTMCEGEALVATQAAIWSYSNGALNVHDGKDGVIVNDTFYYATIDKGYGIDVQRKARMQLMYYWLMGLELEEPDAVTTVINEQNFVEDFALTVGDKVGEVENEGATNGIYETDLNFTLAFAPTDKDDLLVCLKYIDMDGQEIAVTKRLAGNAAEGETYGKLLPSEDGSYTFENLRLSENRTFNFDLNLQGVQYLEQGVYIYTAYGGVAESQTMVGIAEGKRTVDITASVDISFSVDEDKAVEAEHHWRDKSDLIINETDPPAEEEEVPEEEIPEEEVPEEEVPEEEIPEEEVPVEEVPVEEIPDEEVPRADVPDGYGNDYGFTLAQTDEALEELPDEEIPLADVPKTGDVSPLLIAMIVLAGFGLVALNLSDKKRDHTNF